MSSMPFTGRAASNRMLRRLPCLAAATPAARCAETHGVCGLLHRGTSFRLRPIVYVRQRATWRRLRRGHAERSLHGALHQKALWCRLAADCTFREHLLPSLPQRPSLSDFNSAIGPEENFPIPWEACRLSKRQRTGFFGSTKLLETSKMTHLRHSFQSRGAGVTVTTRVPVSSASDVFNAASTNAARPSNTTALENRALLEDVHKAAGHRDPSTGRLDDRPPFLNLGFLERGKRFRRLLLARQNFVAKIGQTCANRSIRQRVPHSSI